MTVGRVKELSFERVVVRADCVIEGEQNNVFLRYTIVLENVVGMTGVCLVPIVPVIL